MVADPRRQRLATLAQRYATQGRRDAADRICRQLVEQDPADPFAALFLADRHLETGQPEAAVPLLEAVCERQPEDAHVRRRLADALSRTGRADAAGAQWIRLLESDAGRADDWAELGRLHRDAGDPERAARCFTRAFITDPTLAEARRNPAAPLARRHLSQDGDDLLPGFHFERNRALVAALAEDAGEPLPERWHRFLRRFHRREPTHYADPRQQPDYHYYEGLPARPFWPRETFPWLAEVEAATEVIRGEFLAAMDADGALEPYVHAVAHAPEDWQAMSGRLDWASLKLIRGNRPVEANCARCPRTAALFEELPLARADGHAPEVFFSVLRPGTHIPPHYGVSNSKLAIHLPLIIPHDCAIRVGGETREWRLGECLIFDDSFLHEAWNRSEELRVVLIFETWNPDLSALELACLRSVIESGERWCEEALALVPASAGIACGPLEPGLACGPAEARPG